MEHIKQQRIQEQGFTLVELSIVLVIIGLIVGGILVGQDMIKAAEIRSTVSQIGSYNSAMNTFRDKYRYLPGDIMDAAANAAGLVDRAPLPGRGNGNSLIEGYGGATIIAGETLLVWRDLNQMGMLDGSYVTAVDGAAITNTMPTAATTGNLVKLYLPEANLGRGNYITVYSTAGVNYYQILGMTAIVQATGVPTQVAALTPQEALNLDQKLDDGRPQTGSTRAMQSTGGLNNAYTVVGTVTIGSCINATALASGGEYNTAAGAGVNTAEANSNSPACSLRVRFN